MFRACGLINSALFIWMSILVIYVRSNRPDLSNMQIAILLMIYMTPGPHYANEIAAGLQASKTSVSKAVSRLVSLGFLQQVLDHDQRRKRILPTEKGEAFLADLKRAVEPALKSRAAKLQRRGSMRDIDLVGDGFRAAFPVPEESAFDDLLAKIKAV
jgi:DNA-binding MarR family transcriptional regulator